MIEATLLAAGHPDWLAEIERIRARIDPADVETFFPDYFLAATLPRIGGYIARFSEGGRWIGAGFLFPRRPDPNRPGCARTYTLRYHALRQNHAPETDHDDSVDRGSPSLLPARSAPDALTAAAQIHLPGACVVFYDPRAPQRYAPDARPFGTINIGRPSQEEAAHIRELQACIWGSAPDAGYPADIHGLDFGLGSSLVARVEGRLAGFLLGFIKFGGPRLPADWHERFHGDLRLESQVMGVSPDFRGTGIGGLLKRVQGQDARAEGMGVVHWTFDPLQFPNAALNFGRLRALAFDFYPDLYPFRNALNRLPASRFGVTWLVGGRRVQAAFASDARVPVPDLGEYPRLARVNRGPLPVDSVPDSPRIAIEIPADWTGLQQRDPVAAAAWREATDRLFARLVGQEPGRYVITGVARAGDRRFLVGERAEEGLWARLGA